MENLQASISEIPNHYRAVQDLKTLMQGDIEMSNLAIDNAGVELSNAVYACEAGEECGTANKRYIDRHTAQLNARVAALSHSSVELKKHVYGLLRQNGDLLEALGEEQSGVVAGEKHV